MVIVSDTSPVTNLIKIGEFNLLKNVFETIVIPQIVYEELCVLDKQKAILEQADWIRVVELKDSTLKTSLLLEVDKGEAEAIALAIELKADYLLIDEQAGRAVAERLGIKITGIIGILIQAKQKGFIVKVKPYLERLINEASFRISPTLFKNVIALLNE
jgi:uncharacterized protein